MKWNEKLEKFRGMYVYILGQLEEDICVLVCNEYEKHQSRGALATLD